MCGSDGSSNLIRRFFRLDGFTCWFFYSSGSNTRNQWSLKISNGCQTLALGIWFLLYPFGFGYLKIPKSKNRWVRVSPDARRNSWFWVFKTSSKNRWVSWKNRQRPDSFKTGSYLPFSKKLRTVNIYNNTKFDFFNKNRYASKPGTWFFWWPRLWMKARYVIFWWKRLSD